jgi:protein SCO1/2
MSSFHKVVFLVLVLGFLPGAAHAQPLKQSPAEREAKAREYFTDSDALKGKVVLINFVFTQCSDACPLITARLVLVKNALGEAFGRDVRFLSISIDPENDRPQDLARFAQKLDAQHPEWWFLTGEKASVEAVVSKLGAFTPERESHLTAMIVGSTGQGRWKKVRPDAPPAIVAEELRQLVAAQAEARKSAQWAR